MVYLFISSFIYQAWECNLMKKLYLEKRVKSYKNVSKQAEIKVRKFWSQENLETDFQLEIFTFIYFIYLFIYSCLCLRINLFIIGLFIGLLFYLLIALFIYLPIYLLVYFFIYPFIY